MEQIKMARKLKTVTLTYPYPNPNQQGVFDYRVEKVGNSVDLVPYQMLTKAEVEVLCVAHNWTVIVIPSKEQAP
jgi:hypothetical protein